MAEEKGLKERSFKISRLIFHFLVWVFVGVSAYTLLFSPYLEINDVYIYGIEELDGGRVEESVDSFLEEKYFRILSGKNLLVARSGVLERKLEDDFKKIERAEVKKVFPGTIIVSILERKALLVWCSGESCVLVDEKGMAYAEADFDSQEIRENNLIVIHDQSRSEISFDRAVFDPRYGNFLVEFRKKSEDSLGVRFTQNFDTPKAISGDLTGTTEEGWKVNLNATVGAEKEISMLKIVLDKNISPEKRKELEYVDLRTEGKVYYKFKSDNPEGSTEKE